MSAKSNSKQARNLIALGLLVPCLLISIPAVLAFRAERQLAGSFGWVSHTLEVQRQLQRLLTLLVDAETAERGFLLSSENYYLEPYQSALDQLPQQVATLRLLTSDNPIQQTYLRQLTPLVVAKLDLITRTIALQQRGDHEGVLALLDTQQGRQTMDAIRARIELLAQGESQLLATRQEALASHARSSTAILSALVVLNFFFAGALLVMFRSLAKAQSVITMCAWSHTVEYQGQWLSFEEYLRRRFNLNCSHGISPAEAERVFGPSTQRD